MTPGIYRHETADGVTRLLLVTGARALDLREARWGELATWLTGRLTWVRPVAAHLGRNE